jgi:tRNA1(Val) A37 N6-methylase TrmN6
MSFECCCSDYNKMFNLKHANRDLKRYKKKGLSKETRILYDALKHRIDGLSVIEVGSGIGDLAIELVSTGASRYFGSDLSEPSLNAANRLVSDRGFGEKIEFINDNIIDNDQLFVTADLVLSNKVVCCYPYMQKFIEITVGKAGKYYAIVYPRDNIGAKIVGKIVNLILSLIDSGGFCVYIHDTKKINEIIRSYGFQRVFYGKTFIWEVLVFEKLQ